jgi:PST family polysaccharide transporter
MSGSLRDKVMVGGAFLALRQALGMVISLGSILFLTRAAGPAAYGVFTAAMAVFGFVQCLTQWGLSVYLVRQEGEERLDAFHQAATLLAVLGLAGFALTAAAMPALAGWTNLPGFGPVLLAVMATLPLALVTQVAIARLERQMRYKHLAQIELTGQLTYFLAALPLALSAHGAWAFVVGYWANQLQSTVLIHRAAGFLPRPTWQPALIREMLSYGLAYSASTWIWALRNLVNPMIVGRYAGAEAVGYVALAIRFVSILSFIKNAAWRISIAALGRLQHAPAQMTHAISEGMRYSVLGLGPILTGFAIVAPWLVPLLYGPQWTPVALVFPWIALGSLGHAVFQLHFSALHVLRRNAEVSSFYALHVLLFAGAAAYFVPRFGLIGYGWAEAVALPGYWLIHAWTAYRVGRPRYGPTAVWLAAWLVPLFAWRLGPWAWASVLLPLGWRPTRTDLVRQWAHAQRLMRERRKPRAP